MTASLDRLEAAVRGWLAEPRDGPLMLGLCGAQGSGKSTLAAGLAGRVGVRTAILSLDDLYLSGAERTALARTVHPLLRTRGVPLTHDVPRGIALIDAIRRGEAVTLPRFDKARDEPGAGEPLDAPVDLLIFEGWCVGARPQPEVTGPVNTLERDEDPDGRWRRAVNTALAEDYAALFARIDRLVLVAAPDFAVVERWRGEQEAALRTRLEAAGADTSGLMDPAGIARFVQHYERLTRWILAEMPARADLVLRLDETRALCAG